MSVQEKPWGTEDAIEGRISMGGEQSPAVILSPATSPGFTQGIKTSHKTTMLGISVFQLK